MKTPRSHVFFCQGCQTTRSVVHLERSFRLETDEAIFQCDECLDDEAGEPGPPVNAREVTQEIEENGVWAAAIRWAVEYGQDLSLLHLLDAP